MIEKMKFLSITGPRTEFDHFVANYLNKYDIHLENALSELSHDKELKPFVEINPYKELLHAGNDLIKRLETKSLPSYQELAPKEAARIIKDVSKEIEEIREKRKVLKEERNHLQELLELINHFKHLDYDIDKILDFKYIKFRFGRMPHQYFKKFSGFIYDSLPSLFFESDRDENYVWGVYFVPSTESIKTDAIYSSMHFERIFIPAEYHGTPQKAFQEINEKLNNVLKILDGYKQGMNAILSKRQTEVLNAYETLRAYSANFDVRKLAACTSSNRSDMFYFILCGWIPQSQFDDFMKAVEQEPDCYCLPEDEHSSVTTKTPTKLKNFKLFKPFEMFIKMYGMPAYNEIDPTSFVAITYSLLFGIMFGDVGQGACLAIGGYLLYRFKKMNLAAIISCAGVFSTIFGFAFGSIFGFEDIIPALWLHPMHNVMTVLFTAVGFGVALIIIAMIMNIINGIREKNIEKIFFDTNGVAGLVFYAAAIACVLLIFTGNTLPGIIVLSIFFGIPFLIMFLKEPLTHLVEKKAKILPDNKVMFFVEAFFEMIEILLSYVTNSISFLRVGAFAMSHAAMMGVVMLLAGANDGSPNIIVVILGNIFVTLLEGLIVGIQVLRLEYYEMFSRFYRGTGKEFKPYKKK